MIHTAKLHIKIPEKVRIYKTGQKKSLILFIGEKFKNRPAEGVNFCKKDCGG